MKKRYWVALAIVGILSGASAIAQDSASAFLDALQALQQTPDAQRALREALAGQVTTLKAQQGAEDVCPDLVEKAGLGAAATPAGGWLPVFERALNVVEAMSPGGGVQAAVAAPKNITYNNHVRPILSDACFACHGPDSSKRKAGLRLDTEAAAYAALTSGTTPIVPGNRATSEVFARITTSDPDDKMPPAESHKTLTSEQIEIIGQWIDGGAKYEKHWAFVAPKPVTPPAVVDATWTKNDIDKFIRAALDEHGLTPNPEAEKRTLIRRAYLDLTGMPPTPEAVEQFVNDAAPDAYDRLVDELLASPRFGERWGRHWLDIARFAESHGYEQDYDRPYAFHYRDFVIRAFNEDMPYDTFVKWQLAGDEFAPDNSEALKATGFLGAGVHSTQITLSQVEKERYDELDDMSRTVGTAMLGLTVGCARCHDHKYDPIPAQDYYRLLSTFTTTVRSDFDVRVDPAKYAAEKAAFDAEHAPLVGAQTAFETTLRKTFDERVDAGQSIGGRPKWASLNGASLVSTGGATFAEQGDGSSIASGTNADLDTYTLSVTTPLKGVSALRLDALADDSLPSKGPGRADNGNFALSRIRVYASPADGSVPESEVPLAKPQASHQQEGFPVSGALDEDDATGWAVGDKVGQEHWALFEFATPVGFDGGTTYRVVLDFKINTKHTIGRPRVVLTTSSIPISPDGSIGDHRVVALLQKRNETPWIRLSPEEKDTLFAWYKTNDAVWKELNSAVNEHASRAPKETEKVMIASEGVPAIRTHTQGGDFLENTHFLKRGDPNQKDGVATQGFLTVLTNGLPESHWQETPPPGAKVSYRRRSLANWITDYENGAGFLLARVIVNRLWAQHMGQGIVATPSDFGYQGEAPSNPALLDWLAGELVRNGWRLKPIHKLIMTSATYRQSSAFDEAKANIDRMNKYNWRFARRRLEAEAIRDSMLATSGMLDQTMFGQGTLDPNMRRRSVYFFVKRSRLVPMMILFDGPDSTQGLDKRARTTIAPQALMLMNNPILRSYSEAFAQRVRPDANTTTPQAVTNAFMYALSRTPTDTELAQTSAFLDAQTQDYAASGEKQPAQRALADFCQVLFSSNEFVFTN